MSALPELPTRYDPGPVEGKWYQRWIERNDFGSTPAPSKKPYTIVIPPPNVTGALHMGHALNTSLQDILIRWRRMQGFEALWVPGTDHAGIATQSVVENIIFREEKKKRHDLGRDELLRRIWASTSTAAKPVLRVMLCSPRGFCAGVVRAIDTVEKTIARYGAPVYVRHEIVHNRFVVESLKAKGAIFVEELDEIPDTTAPVIFSAHGVPKSIPDEAKKRNFFALDATCPLVTKVHREAEIHHKRGRQILLIGHAGHPEVVGTIGQLPPGAITLIETVEDIASFQPRDPANLAYVTQTTLSVDEPAGIVAALKAKFPQVHGPHKEDICYATTNRQEVVKEVAPRVDAMVVVGSPNSSNTQRLKEVAERAGCSRAALVNRAADIDWTMFSNIGSLGITAGASAPEVLVEEVIAAFAERYDVKVETVTTAEESMFFPLPRALRENEAAE
jgi:4-hydroxy-3-methylbut-2-enyl diphosphate reductase